VGLVVRVRVGGKMERKIVSFQERYLDDALGECNEMIVSLSHAKDIYYKYVDVKLCEELITIYDISGKQIYRLSESWSKAKGKTTHCPSTLHNSLPTLTLATNKPRGDQ
jgi:hypothetical protein